MKTFLILALFFSVSSFAKCVEIIDSNRISTINILSSYDYSNCTDRELTVTKDFLERFLDERVVKMKEEYSKRESETGNIEKFRVLTEINPAKTSYQFISSEIKDRESL